MKLVTFIKENRMFVFVTIIASVLWLVFAHLTIVNSANNNDEFIELETSRSLIQYNLTLNTIFSKIENVETYINTIGLDNVTKESFDNFTSNLSFEDVGFVSLSIAPQGIIEYYFSVDHDEGLIGYDLLNDDRDYVKDAIDYAILNRVIVVNGPYDLMQGNTGVVFRKPIFLDDEFIGLINFVVDSDVLAEHFSDYENHTIHTGVYDTNENLILGTSESAHDIHVRENIELEYVDWHIGIQVTKEYQRAMFIQNAFLGLGFTFILVVVVAFSTYFYTKNKSLILNQRQLIYYDNLTSLPNRRLFEEETTILIDSNTQFFLGFGDLDNFKNINDVLGHSIGDEYLSFVATHLKSLESDNLKIYRWGGDEFIFVFLYETKEEIVPVLDRIFEIFKSQFEVKETKHQISISMGMVEFPADGTTIDELVKHADIVMYDIKAQYKNTYSFFEQKYLKDLYQQIEFQQEIDAFDVSDFEIYLQPILNVKTDTILGFEGLSRLFDSEGKQFPTQDIIKLYEHDGTITKLDKYVFRKICGYLEHFTKENKREYFFTFNISPLSLTIEYIDYLEETISEFNFDPALIVVEIIETLGFKDVKISIELLERIKRLGLKIAMDDFGMGYSSLSYVAKLPLDLIKIDRSFIQNYETDAFNRTILHTIKEISNSLQLEVLVEGIETSEQLKYITNLGAHYYQGFLHSRPMSFDDVLELILLKE